MISSNVPDSETVTVLSDPKVYDALVPDLSVTGAAITQPGRLSDEVGAHTDFGYQVPTRSPPQGVNAGHEPTSLARSPFKPD